MDTQLKFLGSAVLINHSAVGESFGNVALELQNSVDQSEQWGMNLNVGKTKVMFFGREQHKQQHYSIKLYNSTIEQVSCHCYLGVILDQCLDFHLQVEKVVGKVKRATNKVGMLFKERSGIPVKIATDLYKSLVRPHLDFAAPVWASVNDNDMQKFEQVQAQSLRRFIGAKRHSSTAATEVITGFMPVRFRFGDLCCREYVKLLRKEASHPLKQLMNCSVREGAKFTPLEFMKYKSRDMLRIMSSSDLECEGLVPMELVLADRQIEQIEICKGIGNTRNRTSQERELGMNQFHQFVSLQKQSSLIIFTDGSVVDGPIGCGACSAVVVSPDSFGTRYEWSQPVGRLVENVENVECEAEGIVLAMELAIHVVRNEKQQQLGSDVHLL